MNLYIDNLNRKSKIEALEDKDAELVFLGVDARKDTAFIVAQKIAKLARADCCLFLNADLQLCNSHLGDFAGLAIVEELRSRADFLAFANPAQLLPIVLYSTFSEGMAYKNEDRAKLLNMPGIAYEQCVHPQQLLNLSYQLAPVDSAEQYRDYFSQAVQDNGDESHQVTNLFAFCQAVEGLFHLQPDEKIYNLWEKVQLLGSEVLRNESFLQQLNRKGATFTQSQPLLQKRLDDIQKHFNSVSGARQQIILIDDQANQIHPNLSVGWSDLYALLWYRAEQEVIVLDYQMKDKHLLKKLRKKGLALVLDYYLHTNDRQEELLNTRAAGILQAVKNWNPSFPVAIATASDKAYSLREFQEIGCDTYWIKPSPRIRPGQKTVIETLLDFSWQIRMLTGMEYGFFRQSFKLLDELTTADTWWEKLPWGFPCKPFDKEALINGLRNELNEFRNHYINSIGSPVKWIFAPFEEKRSVVVGTIMLLTDWVEQIHACPQRKVPELRKRQDFLGVTLYQTRNATAHDQNSKMEVFDFNWAADFFKCFIGYLYHSPVEINQAYTPSRKRQNIQYYLAQDGPIRRLFDEP